MPEEKNKEPGLANELFSKGLRRKAGTTFQQAQKRLDENNFASFHKLVKSASIDIENSIRLEPSSPLLSEVENEELRRLRLKYYQYFEDLEGPEKGYPLGFWNEKDQERLEHLDQKAKD